MACRGFRFLFTIALCTTVLANSHESHGKSHDLACLRKYTIIEGDTCDKISAHQHVSTHQLAHTNKKINPGCTNLSIGDVLCLGLKGQDCTKVHVVKEGDICASVAKKAGIPLDDLFKNNPNINKGCTNIYPGEVLCVTPAVNSTTTTIAGAHAVKGTFPPSPFPLLNATHGSRNITFPPVNLTSTGWGNSTGTLFNASFPTFNSSIIPGLNTSFPFVGTQSNFTFPAFNETIPAFNHTHSFKNSTNANTTSTASASAANSAASLFGDLTLPNFAPTPTINSGIDGFGADFGSTTTTTTSTTTTLSASTGASVGTSGSSASVGSSTTTATTAT